MMQTYEDTNKLHLLKIHANKCITPFFYMVGFSVSINIWHVYAIFLF